MSDFPFKHNSQFHICFVSVKKNQRTNMQLDSSSEVQAQNTEQKLTANGSMSLQGAADGLQLFL